MQFDASEWEVLDEKPKQQNAFDPNFDPGEWELADDGPAPGAKPDFVDRFVKPGMEATRQPQGPAQDDDLWDWGSMKASFRPYVEGARGLAAGSASVGEAAGSGLQYLGNRLGLEGVARAGEKVADYYGGQAQAYAPPEHLRGNVIDEPGMLMDPSFWTYNVGQMAPSLAAAIIPGAGVGKAVQIGGKAIQLTPQVIARASALGQALGAGAAGGALEGAGTYRETMKQGASEEEAARAGEIMGAGSAALNALSFGTMLGKMGGKMGGGAAARAGKHLVAGATEGITEGAEEPWEEYAKSFAHYLETGDFDPETWGRMVEAAKTRGLNVAGPAALVGAGGSVMAGGGESAMFRSKGQRQGYDANQIPTEEAPLDLSEWEEVRNERAAFPGQQDQFMERVGDEREVPLDLTRLEQRGYPDAVDYDLRQAGQDMARARNLERQEVPAQEPSPVGPVGEAAGRALDRITEPVGQPGEAGERAGALLEQVGQPQRFELGDLSSEWEIVDDTPAQESDAQGLDYDFRQARAGMAQERDLEQGGPVEGEYLDGNDEAADILRRHQQPVQYEAERIARGKALPDGGPYERPRALSAAQDFEFSNPIIAKAKGMKEALPSGGPYERPRALPEGQDFELVPDWKRPNLPVPLRHRPQGEAINPDVYTEAQLAKMGKGKLNRVATAMGIDKPGKIAKSKLVPIVLEHQEARQAVPVVANETQAKPVVSAESPIQDTQAGENLRAEISESKENPQEEQEIGVSKAVAETEASKDDAPASGLISISRDDIPLQVAHDAHTGTSMVPDKRAEQEQQDYVLYMEAVRDDLMKRVPQEKHAELAKELERFKEGEIKHRLAHLGAKSRVVSWMIAGRSNFPAARMEKRNRTEQNRYEEHMAWRKRALKAIELRMGIGIGSDIIHSTDNDATDKLQAKLDKLRDVQEQMKKANSEWRRTNGDVDAMDVGDTMKKRVREWAESDNAVKGRQPFPGYALRNNGANIRSAEKRLAQVEAQQARPGSEVEFDGGRVVDDADAGRVRVYFDAKPGEEVRGKLKKRGFHWARGVGAWQRKRTTQALEVAREVVGAVAASGDTVAAVSMNRDEKRLSIDKPGGGVVESSQENSHEDDRSRKEATPRGREQDVPQGQQPVGQGRKAQARRRAEIVQASTVDDFLGESKVLDSELFLSNLQAAVEDGTFSQEEALSFVMSIDEGADILAERDEVPFGQDDAQRPWLRDAILDMLDQAAREGIVHDEAMAEYERVVGALRKGPGLSYKSIQTNYGESVARKLQQKFGLGFLRKRKGMGADDVAGELGFVDDDGRADGHALVDYLLDKAQTKTEISRKTPKPKFSRSAASTQGIRSAEVSEVVDRLQAMAVNAPDVQVVQTMNNLPARVREEYQRRGNGIPESAYDEATGTVYFVADNIDSKARAVALWLHEAGLHNGVRGLFSSPRHHRNAMAQVYRSAPKYRLREIEKRYGLSKDSLEDNLVAAEEYLAQVAEKVRMNEVLAPRERTLWQRIVSAIQRFARRALRGGRLSDADIADIVHDAVRWTVAGKPTGAARNAYQRATGEAMARTTSGTARFSRRGASDKEQAAQDYGRRVSEAARKWAQVVDDMFAGKMHPRAILQMGKTPDLLVELGAPDLPLTMQQVTFKKIVGIEPDPKSGHLHHLTKRQMKNLYAGLADPVAVMQPHAGKMEVVVEMIEDGKPVLAALGLDAQEGRVQVNSVATAFGHNRAIEKVVGAAGGGALKYMDPKRLDALEDRSDNLKRNLTASVRVLRARRGKKIKFPGDVVKPVGRAWFSRKEGPSLKGGVPSESQDPGFWEMAREMKRRGALKEKDLGLMEKVLRQPYWLAKDHEQFQPFIKIEQDREAARTDALLRSWGEVDGHLKALDKEGRAILSKIIWRIEGTKVQGVEADKFVKDGQDENGHQMYRVNPRHYEQLYKVLTEHNAPEDVARAVCAIRRTLDRDMLAAYNRLRRMRESKEDAGAIEDYRTMMGQVHNYFPHIRRGTHYVRIFDKESGGTLYREHFNAGPKMKRFKGAKLMRRALSEVRKEHPEAKLDWDWGKNQGLPEDVYGFTIPVDAMEQIITAAIDRQGGDKENRAKVKSLMHEAVADVLKTRGWSRHTIKRQGIPGHETEDIAGLLFEYKAGLYGWLTKMDAAKAFTGELYNIDAKKTPRLYGYAARYVQDMLQNSDRIDQVVSMVKAGAFIKFLGGNLKTATLNLTQNLVAGVPRLYADTSARTAAGYFKAAVDDLAAQAKVKTLKADERKLLEDLYYSGVTADQYMRELQGEMRGVGGVPGAAARKANQWLGTPMSLAERFNRCSLALAAYRAARDGKVTAADTLENVGKKKGEAWGYEDAKAFAEGIVYDSHFMYGKANRPELFRGGTGNKVMSAAYTFRTFTHGLLSLWRNLLFKKGGAGRRAFAMSLAANATLGGLSSLPMYALVVGLIRQLLGRDPVEGVMQATGNQALRDIMVYGALAPAGVTISGSLGMELPMFNRFNVRESAVDQIKGNAMEIIGVPWAMIESFADAGGQVFEGKPGRAVETLSPAFIANIMKAYRLHKDGAYTASGRPINIPGETGPMKLTTGEAIAQAVGFYPLRRAKSYDMYRTIEELKAYRLEKQNDLVKDFLDAVRGKDDKARAEVLTEWRAWNKRMRDDGRTEYLIEPLPKLARMRAKARQPEKRMRGRAHDLKKTMGF